MLPITKSEVSFSDSFRNPNMPVLHQSPKSEIGKINLSNDRTFIISDHQFSFGRFLKIVEG